LAGPEHREGAAQAGMSARTIVSFFMAHLLCLVPRPEVSGRQELGSSASHAASETAGD